VVPQIADVLIFDDIHQMQRGRMENKLVERSDLLIYSTSAAAFWTLALSLNTLIINGPGVLVYVTVALCVFFLSPDRDHLP
jgi:hypothetical protein